MSRYCSFISHFVDNFAVSYISHFNRLFSILFNAIYNTYYKMNSKNLSSLKTLVDKSHSGITIKNREIDLKIWPQYFSDIKKGITVALQELEGGYNKRLGGLLLGYENLHVFDGTGWLDSSIHVLVTADFYIFAPEVGFVLKGTVNHRTAGRITFLVLDKFNVVFYKNRQLAALAESGDEEAVEYLKSIDDTLLEGSVCMLKLCHVVLLDFIPDLQGYPVSCGAELTSSASPSPIPNRRKVTFSPQVSSDSEIEKPKLSGIAERPSSCKQSPPTIKKKKKNKNKELSRLENNNNNGVIDDSPVDSKEDLKHLANQFSSRVNGVKVEVVENGDESLLNESSNKKKKKKKRKFEEVDVHVDEGVDSASSEAQNPKKKRKIAK